MVDFQYDTEEKINEPLTSQKMYLMIILCKGLISMNQHDLLAIATSQSH